MAVKPKITLRSSSPVVVNESEATTLVCRASGNPWLYISWRKESAKFVQEGCNYTIATATKDHAGTYTCTATIDAPGLGSFSTNYTVSVIVRRKLH